MPGGGFDALRTGGPGGPGIVRCKAPGQDPLRALVRTASPSLTPPTGGDGRASPSRKAGDKGRDRGGGVGPSWGVPKQESRRCGIRPGTVEIFGYAPRVPPVATRGYRAYRRPSRVLRDRARRGAHPACVLPERTYARRGPDRTDPGTVICSMPACSDRRVKPTSPPKIECPHPLGFSMHCLGVTGTSPPSALSNPRTRPRQPTPRETVTLA